MKKVKVMLSAIAVVAVVGGALAFKAANLNTGQFYTCDAANNTCVINNSGNPVDFALDGNIVGTVINDPQLTRVGQQCDVSCPTVNNLRTIGE